MIFDSSLYNSSENGLGQSSAPTIVAASGNIAAGTIPGVLVGTNVLAAGSLAVPIIGAAIAGVTLAVSMFLNRNATYFAQASATTHIVDEAETLLKNNLNAWNESNKYLSERSQALSNFNAIWNQVVSACSNSGYGDPGVACIADRSRGGRWDWFEYYYDPIASDSETQSDPIASSNSGGVTSVISNVGESVSNFVDDVVSGNFVDSDISKLLVPALLLVGGIWAIRKVI